MNTTDRNDPQGTEAPTRAAESEAFAIQAARIAADNKSEDVAVLDLRGLSSLADYFVLATGTSERQMHAVLEFISDHARDVGRRPLHKDNRADCSWLVGDYVDVVVHVFDDESRAFYDLDGLWGDARRVPWEPDDPGDA